MAIRASLKMAWSTLLLAVVVTGCQSNSDAVIYDNYGIAGYARLQGTVSHADGSPFGIITIRYSCSDPKTTWFADTTTTDAQGAFDIALAPPGAGLLAASGTLSCQVSAMDRDSVIARVRATTAFSQNADARPITTFTLIEGQVLP